MLCWSQCRKAVLSLPQLKHTLSSRHKHTFGLLIDIDGVLTRGSQTIKAALDGIQRLKDPSNGHLSVPVVFLTNGSDISEVNKAEMLSHRLGVKITADQVVLVNSPLRTFKSWHDSNILFAGQGDVERLARNLGFIKPITTDSLISDLPMLDVVDHCKRHGRGVLPDLLPEYLPLEGIVITNTPIQWETQIQLMLDVLMTGGTLREFSDTPPPVLACNPDLLWAAEYHLPRLANGAFVHMLGSLYTELTGRVLDIVWCGKPTSVTYNYAKGKLKLQADRLGVEMGDIYGIGDNVDVDVVGANNADLKSVLVCSGLYKNSNVVLESDLVVRSKLASRTEGIHCDFIAKDVGIFINHLIDDVFEEVG